MAILGITSQGGRLFCPETPCADARLQLAHALNGIPDHAPIVVMLHGYRYHAECSTTDPHQLLYSTRPDLACGKFVSWPLGLGFSELSRNDGLAIGFAWEGRVPKVVRRKFDPNPFAKVYHQATRSGGHVARLLSWIAELAPTRKVDLIAHSLGARVALGALARTKTNNVGRVILMGAAEHRSVARRIMHGLPPGRGVQVFNITARENLFFDRLFETFSPRPSWRDKSIGRGCEGLARNWLNICTDDPHTLDALSARGVGLAARDTRVTHWGFYTRAGMFFLYKELIRNRPIWQIEDLRRDISSQVSHTVHPALRPVTMS